MRYCVNNFFSESECSYFIKKSLEIGIPFNYNPNENWDCRRIYDEELKLKVYEILENKYKTGAWDLWIDLESLKVKSINISLTSYYEGRYLNLHKDSSSDLTIVIVLNDGYEDGRFAIADNINNNYHFENLKNIELISLSKGDGISFIGSDIFHGVLPVTKNIRYALNIWLSGEENKFIPMKKERSFI
jgi:Rps23 Pro-64 3,4-dihydroxylase Tpa1-like proline 4-hydroxylase